MLLDSIQIYSKFQKQEDLGLSLMKETKKSLENSEVFHLQMYLNHNGAQGSQTFYMF